MKSILRPIISGILVGLGKFTSTGSVSVRVFLSSKVIAKKDSIHEIQFEVTDTGLGISDEALGRMFQLFSQADSSTSRRFGGTGLGLSICKQLVELMNGQIGVRSQLGQSSTFWFQKIIA
ncbi:MAG: hypothetical protein H7256_09475 [Bdellovibrio sp.]|nr:hypothetical protein [Bdellovibrio sp.]